MDLTTNDFIDEEDKRLLQVWEDFFRSPGWQLVIQRFEPRIEASVGALEAAKDMKALGRVSGERSILNEIVGLEKTVEFEFRSHLAAQATDAADDIESRGAMA